MIHIITDLSEKEKAILDKISQVSIKIQSERVCRYCKIGTAICFIMKSMYRKTKDMQDSDIL